MQLSAAPRTTFSASKDFAGRGAKTQARFEVHRVVVLFFVALLAFSLWIAVMMSVPPHGLLTYAAFLALLWVFLGATLSAGLYCVSGREEPIEPHALPTSVRRGGSIALMIVVDMGLSAAHRWHPLAGLLALAFLALVELLARSKTRGPEAFERASAA